MKQTEALKLALEALEKHGDAYLGHFDEYQFAITKAKEALAVDKESLTTEAQPVVAEQHKQSTTCGEPVAVLFEDGSIVKYEDLEFVPEKSGQRVQMLYTTPPQRKPLTDEQKDAARWRWLSWHIKVAWNEGKFTSLVRIVSDKDREALNASIDRMMAGDWSDTEAAHGIKE